MRDDVVNPVQALEWLNGGGLVLAVSFLFLISLYLFKESRRRKLTPLDWLHGKIPPNMHFAVAIAVCDAGIGMRSGLIWGWRKFFAGGPFGKFGITMLAISAALIAIGFVCKIRSISRPDWGDGPWLAAVAALAVFLIFFR